MLAELHPAPVLQCTDRRAILDFVERRAFATVVATIEDHLVVAQVPVLVDSERLLLHLSRATPWRGRYRCARSPRCTGRTRT
jgi:predicted FMN-binding regulatory protein PaiB